MTTDQETRLKNAEIIFTADEIDQAITAMANDLTLLVGGECPLLLCVMNGGLIVTGHLVTRLPFALELDYLHATRYGDQTRGGELRWVREPQTPLRGRCVVLVDDILDEGKTLEAIRRWCLDRGARRVVTAVLVHKEHDRKGVPGMRADVTGLVAPDRFLVGFGMDWRGVGRNLPDIRGIG